jgi:predicted amidohydrolase
VQQFGIRPVSTFDEFRSQVATQVERAATDGCKLIVFPEYFTTRLLTVGDVSRPMTEQIRDLADYAPQVLELVTDLARKYGVYMVGGTTPVLSEDGQRVNNVAYVANPAGDYGVQGKLHVTRFEAEEWGVAPATGLQVFETQFGSMAVAICYDVEFPEVARRAAQHGARLLVVPSCTEDRQGYLRVRYCAHARAVENQIYVVHAPTVGTLPLPVDILTNYGQASILTPIDHPFAEDGILSEGHLNEEMTVTGELNWSMIAETRCRGAVLPLRDSARSIEATRTVTVCHL